MITLLYGENVFERDQALTALASSFDGEVERLDGSVLTTNDIAELTMGASLFSSRRMVIIRDVSSNKEVWLALEPWLERVADDIHLVLVEDAVDKRTKTFKAIKKQGTVKEYPALQDRQQGTVIQWLTKRAAERYNFTLSRAQSEFIVTRVGIDQARLDQLLKQIALMDTVDDVGLERLLPLAKNENVFALFEAGAAGDRQRVHQIIHFLEESEGQDSAYQTIGLLSTQVWQLAAMVYAAGDSDAVARDFGIHPFVLRKLASVASSKTHHDLTHMTQTLLRADRTMKTTAVTPWLLVEHAVLAWSE